MPLPVRLLITALASAALALLTVAPALSAPAEWTAPAPLAPATSEYIPGMSAAGSVTGLTVVWADARTVFVADRPPGGTFRVTAGFTSPGDAAVAPVLRVAANGTAIVSFHGKEADGGQGLYTAIRPPGGAFGPVERVPTGAAVLSHAVPVIADDGTAMVQFTRSDARSRIGETQVAVRRAGGWSAPVALSEPGRRSSAGQLAALPDGRVAALWRQRPGAGAYQIFFAVVGRDGEVRERTQLSNSYEIFGSGLGVDAAGGILAAWGQRPSTQPTVVVRRRPPGGAFGEPVPIADARSVAVAADASSVTWWTRTRGLVLRPFAPDGTPGADETLVAPQLAPASAAPAEVASGNLVAWIGLDGNEQPAMAALRRDGAWTVSRLSAGLVHTEVRAAEAPDGSAVVVWVERGRLLASVSAPAVAPAPGEPVPPPPVDPDGPAPAPELRLTAGKLRVGATRATLSVRPTLAATVTVALTSKPGSGVRSVTRRLDAGRATTLRLPLSSRARALLRRRALRFTVKVTARGPVGQRAALGRTVLVRARR
jgi:hypothetical protein